MSVCSSRVDASPGRKCCWSHIIVDRYELPVTFRRSTLFHAGEHLCVSSLCYLCLMQLSPDRRFYLLSLWRRVFFEDAKTFCMWTIQQICNEELLSVFSKLCICPRARGLVLCRLHIYSCLCWTFWCKLFLCFDVYLAPVYLWLFYSFDPSFLSYLMSTCGMNLNKRGNPVFLVCQHYSFWIMTVSLIS